MRKKSGFNQDGSFYYGSDSDTDTESSYEYDTESYSDSDSDDKAQNKAKPASSVASAKKSVTKASTGIMNAGSESSDEGDSDDDNKAYEDARSSSEKAAANAKTATTTSVSSATSAAKPHEAAQSKIQSNPTGIVSLLEAELAKQSTGAATSATSAATNTMTLDQKQAALIEFLRNNGSQEPTVEALKPLMSGINLNFKHGNLEFTPLVTAIKNDCRLPIISELIKNGADVNMRGQEGLTPLYIAVEKSNVQIVELLLAKGAAESINVKCRNFIDPLKPRSPLEYARQFGYTKIVSPLEKALGIQPTSHVAATSSITITTTTTSNLTSSAAFPAKVAPETTTTTTVIGDSVDDFVMHGPIPSQPAAPAQQQLPTSNKVSVLSQVLFGDDPQKRDASMRAMYEPDEVIIAYRNRRAAEQAAWSTQHNKRLARLAPITPSNVSVYDSDDDHDDTPASGASLTRRHFRDGSGDSAVTTTTGTARRTLFGGNNNNLGTSNIDNDIDDSNDLSSSDDDNVLPMPNARRRLFAGDQGGNGKPKTTTFSFTKFYKDHKFVCLAGAALAAIATLYVCRNTAIVVACKNFIQSKISDVISR